MAEHFAERRLHPSAWLFAVSKLLRELAVPLLVFVFVKREHGLWLALGGAGVLLGALWGWLQARAYRYQVLGDELLIREGLLDRQVRHVPFSRIHGINEHRGPLHRLLGVTELRLESASGGKPEAVMRVLSLEAAAELAALLRGRPQPSSAQADATADRQLLLQLRWPELLRLGLISNRGTVVLGVGAGLLAQNRELLDQLNLIAPLRRWLGQQPSLGEAAGHWPSYLLLGLGLFATALVLLRALSVLLALLKYHGFTLEQLGEQGLQARYGLLTRVSAGARRSQLQRLVLEQSWLHRWFKRCRLAVDVAGASDKAAARAPRLRELAPIATPEQAQALVAQMLPGLDLQVLDWQPLHPGARRRRFHAGLRLLLVPLTALLALAVAAPGLGWMPVAVLALAALPLLGLAVGLLAWHAKTWAGFAAYAETADALVWREGVLRQRWTIVVPARLQGLSRTESPFDRRAGMQGLQLDVQGLGRGRPALHIPYLSPERCEALLQRLWAAQTPPGL